MRYWSVNPPGKSIVLIGMMGAGKSCVGRCLQRRTKLALVDTDDIVASKFGMSICEIFSKYGEQGFREAETQALRELAPTLGLKEAKDLVDAAPKEVLSQVNKKTAEEAKAKLTAAGATVELK